MIRQTGRKKYEVVSHTGKNLGTSTSRAGAVRRLQQVEYFKKLAAVGKGKSK